MDSKWRHGAWRLWDSASEGRVLDVGVLLLAVGVLLLACGDDAKTGRDGGGPDGGPRDGQARDGGRRDDGGPGPGCVDVDRDGVCRPADCDDLAAEIHPGAPEVCGNGLDDDCDGEADEDCAGLGRVFYVDKDSLGGTCSDEGPGTRSQPWCTIAKANETLEAGDTVFIREGVYEGATIQPAHSGSGEDARIVYAAEPGEAVVFTGSVYCVRVRERSYVSVVGIQFLDCERNLYIEASDHVNVGYCTFDTPAGPATWAGSRIYHGATFNRIYRCTFSRYGRERDDGGSYDDHGCLLDMGNDNEEDPSDHNLVTDSTFLYGGHHLLGIYSDGNVVRRSVFHNEEWYDCHRDSIGGRCGNRDLILNTSDPEGNARNVIEANVIAFAGVPPDQESSVGLSVRTQYNIVRRNVFLFNDSAGLGLTVDGGSHNDASHNYVYHNVFFHNGEPALADWDPLKCGLLLARWVDDAGHRPLVATAIKNNIFVRNGLQPVFFYYVDEADQVMEGNWLDDADPGFVSMPEDLEPSRLDRVDAHLVAGSSAVDAGVFLTHAVGAGRQESRLVVEDAGYFSDGRGLVPGDFVGIQGVSGAVAVVSVDDDTNTLTLARPVSWEDGAGVSLAYGGQAPDQGAWESW